MVRTSLFTVHCALFAHWRIYKHTYIYRETYAYIYFYICTHFPIYIFTHHHPALFSSSFYSLYSFNSSSGHVDKAQAFISNSLEKASRRRRSVRSAFSSPLRRAVAKESRKNRVFINFLKKRKSRRRRIVPPLQHKITQKFLPRTNPLYKKRLPRRSPWRRRAFIMRHFIKNAF